MIDKTAVKTGSLSNVEVRKASGKGTVFINNGILEFNNKELLSALDPTTRSALKALVSVGAAKVPEGVVL